MALDAAELRLTASELRRRLAADGYDLALLDGVSKDLGIELDALLASWTPTLLRLFRAEARRRSWWRRLLTRLSQ